MQNQKDDRFRINFDKPPNLQLLLWFTNIIEVTVSISLLQLWTSKYYMYRSHTVRYDHVFLWLNSVICVFYRIGKLAGIWINVTTFVLCSWNFHLCFLCHIITLSTATRWDKRFLLSLFVIIKLWKWPWLSPYFKPSVYSGRISALTEPSWSKQRSSNT